MDLILGTLSGALLFGLLKVAEKLGEKVVEFSLEPTIELAKEKMMGGLNRAKAEQELRAKVMAALDEVRSQTTDSYDRLKITNWVTGQSAHTYELMAAAAVEMVDLDAKKVPDKLLAALQLDDSRRELLARFLIHLRRGLAGTESFSKLIVYANDLHRNGGLFGLTKEVENISHDTDRIRSLIEQLTAQMGLTDNDSKALDSYLEYCRIRWSRLMLPLVRKNVGPLSPSLKRIFVKLQVRDEKAEQKARKEMEQKRIRTRLDEVQTEIHPVDFNEAFSRYKKFILVGLPGTGKTTLLRRVALAFAEGRTGDDIDYKGEPKLPIFIRLRNFGIYLAENREKFSEPGSGALVAYLEQHLRNDEGIEIPYDFIEKRLSAGGCVVLLDGLDEVLENRVEVAQFVNAFIDKYSSSDNRIGLSSRPRGYEGDARLQLTRADLALLEVQPLPPPGIRDLIQKLLPLLEPNLLQCQEDYSRLTERILSNQNLTQIAGVPLFCSALVQVFKYHGADLPNRRVDVLAEIVDLLLGFWYAQQSDIRDPEKLARADGTSLQYGDTQESIEQKFNRLAYLAYVMQNELGQAEIAADQAQKLMAVYLKEHEVVPDIEARRWARNFLRNSHEQSGLFVESNPDTYTFLHKNIMEYFVATYLLMDQDEPLEIIKGHLDEEWWEQVLLLAAAHPKANNPFRRKLIPIVLKCAEAVEKGSTTWARRMLVAGWMARDMTTRLPAPQREQIEQVLWENATDFRLKPNLRADIADVLDQFWQPDDLCAFLPINSPQVSFYIGKYPVTNAQYRRFLVRENFSNRDLWCDFPQYSHPDEGGTVSPLSSTGEVGWQWLQGKLQDKDNIVEDGVLYPRFWRELRFGITRPSASVVGVSWWEANAYCRWLCEHWNEVEEGRQDLPQPNLLRLPLEPEWELAAGGVEPKGRYAWDKAGVVTSELADILQRANIDDSGINRTTPVWMYPLGASPAGVMDLAGNVFEWQANYSDKDRDSFTLRGGSWYSSIMTSPVLPPATSATRTSGTTASVFGLSPPPA